MSYRVFWSPNAERRLEHILVDPKFRDENALRVRQVDSALSVDPLGYGESRYDSVRVAFNLPLAIEYEVLEDVHTVIDYDIWQISAK